MAIYKLGNSTFEKLVKLLLVSKE